MDTDWKDIEGYEGSYKISNKGQVWSSHSNGIIEGRDNKGYPRVALYKDGEPNDFFVHRLVARHFIPNPKNKPQVNHIDGNPSNPDVENLEWCTSKENHQHSVDNGLSPRGQKQHLCKLTENDVLDIRNAYRLGCFSYQDLADAYDMSRSAITHIIKKRSWGYL